MKSNNLSTRLEKIDKEFDKRFNSFKLPFAFQIDDKFQREVIDMWQTDLSPELKVFIHSVIQQEIKEAFKKTTPKYNFTWSEKFHEERHGYNLAVSDAKQNQTKYLN